MAAAWSAAFAELRHLVPEALGLVARPLEFGALSVDDLLQVEEPFARLDRLCRQDLGGGTSSDVDIVESVDALTELLLVGSRSVRFLLGET